MKPFNLVGIEARRQFLTDEPATAPAALPDARVLVAPSLGSLVDRLAAGGHGLVMLTGKGGVSRTTLAAAVACTPRPSMRW